MANDYRKCSTCHEYGWFPAHVCAPIWEARIYTRKYEEDWHEVYANDVEQAAAKFCEALPTSISRSVRIHDAESSKRSIVFPREAVT